MEHSPYYFWKNGNIIAPQQAYDFHINHWLHYGSSVFEGIRFYDTLKWPILFRAHDHYERLAYSASIVGLQLTYSIDQLIEATNLLIHTSGMKSWYIRPLIYAQPPHIGLWMPDTKSDIVISLRPMWKYISSNELKVKIVHTRRIHPSTTQVHAKVSWHYTNSLLAIREIQWKGFDEALLCDTNDHIAEWPGENIFFVKDNMLYTPPNTNILPGITRKTIIETAQQELNIPCKETDIHPSELSTFSEAFFVGTAAEVLPIGMIENEDGTAQYNYTTTTATLIQKLYQDIVHGTIPRYLKRLT